MYDNLRTLQEKEARYDRKTERINDVFAYVDGLASESNESILFAIDAQHDALREAFLEVKELAKQEFNQLLANGVGDFFIEDVTTERPICLIRVYSDAIAIIENDTRVLYVLDEYGEVDYRYFTVSMEIALESGASYTGALESIIIPF